MANRFTTLFLSFLFLFGLDLSAAQNESKQKKVTRVYVVQAVKYKKAGVKHKGKMRKNKKHLAKKPQIIDLKQPQTSNIAKDDTVNLQAKLSELASENQKLKIEQQAYLEKIKQLAYEMEKQKKLSTADYENESNITAAYEKLRLEHKRLELSSSMQGKDGFKIYQLEKDNQLLRKQLSAVMKKLQQLQEQRTQDSTVIK